MIIKHNPKTLEQNISILEELEIEFDLNELESFTFEFASRITEREGFEIKDPNYINFMTFIRENYLEDFRESAVFFRQKQEEENIKKYGEKFGPLVPTNRLQLKLYRKDMEGAIESYWLNPVNRDRIEKFDEYKKLRNIKIKKQP